MHNVSEHDLQLVLDVNSWVKGYSHGILEPPQMSDSTILGYQYKIVLCTFIKSIFILTLNIIYLMIKRTCP